MFFDYHYRWEIKQHNCCSTPYASQIGVKRAVLIAINFADNKKGFYETGINVDTF